MWNKPLMWNRPKEVKQPKEVEQRKDQQYFSVLFKKMNVALDVEQAFHVELSKDVCRISKKPQNIKKQKTLRTKKNAKKRRCI